jgi:tRNA pseudouridine55 synthase
MTRRRRAQREKQGPPGFLVVDKPAGWTSHDVVNAARRWLGTRRVGHLGTLDPQATGVLPLAVREATKLVPFLEDGDKSYEGRIRLGVETDTLDGEGRILRRHQGPLPGREQVEDALEGFRGDIEQVPPMYSAVKHGGVPLHRLARKGEEVPRAPKKVRILQLELRHYESEPEFATVEISVECSPGTYVRSLAADLGAQLGCGAYLLSLRRLRSGPFREQQAATPEQLEREAGKGTLEQLLIPPAKALGMPIWTLPPAGERRVRHGGDIAAGTLVRAATGDRVAALDGEGRLLAVLEMQADRRLRPLRVLRPAD